MEIKPKFAINEEVFCKYPKDNLVAITTIESCHIHIITNGKEILYEYKLTDRGLFNENNLLKITASLSDIINFIKENSNRKEKQAKKIEVEDGNF